MKESYVIQLLINLMSTMKSIRIFILIAIFSNCSYGQSDMAIGLQYGKDIYQWSDEGDEHFMNLSTGIILSFRIMPQTNAIFGVSYDKYDAGKGFYGICGTPPIPYKDMELEYTSLHVGITHELIERKYFSPYVSFSLSHQFVSGWIIDRDSNTEFRSEADERNIPKYLMSVLPSFGLQSHITESVSVRLELNGRKYLLSGDYDYKATLGYGLSILMDIENP